MGANRLKLFIRTDANASIATGHLYRCMAIAEAACGLRKSANEGMCDVEFIFGDSESLNVFNASRSVECCSDVGVMSTRALFSYNEFDMEAELPEMKEILKACSAGESGDCGKPILLIDSYYVTERYLRVLSEYAYIAYIDDLRQIDYEYDLVINYDCVNDENRLSYEESYSKAKRKLLGLAYTPLREQFALDKEPDPKLEAYNNKAPGISGKESPVKNILIASGGSDPEHALLRIAEDIMDIPNLHIHLLVGKLCTDRDKLLELAKENQRIAVHENVTDMAGLLTRMDMAVSAAGTTLYELCACSVPTISYSFADNQIPGAVAFDRAGVIPYAGDLRKDCEALASGDTVDMLSVKSSIEVSSGESDEVNELNELNASNEATIHSLIGKNGTCAPLGLIREYITSLDAERALTQASAMHSLIDGHGSERIAKELVNIVK